MPEECWKCKSAKGYIRSNRTDLLYCVSCGSVADYSRLSKQEANGDDRILAGPPKKAPNRIRLTK